MTLLQRKQLRDEKRKASKRRLYLQIPFHPSDPLRRLLQKMWRNLVLNPPGRLPLNQLHTNNLIEDGVSATVPIDQLIIAYRRAPNMGNLLSYRNIQKCTGLTVSSYLDQTFEAPFALLRTNGQRDGRLSRSKANTVTYNFVEELCSKFSAREKLELPRRREK